MSVDRNFLSKDITGEVFDKDCSRACEACGQTGHTKETCMHLIASKYENLKDVDGGHGGASNVQATSSGRSAQTSLIQAFAVATGLVHSAEPKKNDQDAKFAQTLKGLTSQHLLEASFRPPKPVIPAKNTTKESEGGSNQQLVEILSRKSAREMEAFQAEHAANLAENKLREALQRKSEAERRTEKLLEEIRGLEKHE
uniref:CCHC-type domain-containing protein n=1 Tax=Hanusia phi TaxID=3032 RepID=A0A7S0F4F0_9CRYP